MFYPGLTYLSEAQLKRNAPICLVEGISRQHNMQAVAWIWFTLYSQLTVRIMSRKYTRKI